MYPLILCLLLSTMSAEAHVELLKPQLFFRSGIRSFFNESQFNIQEFKWMLDITISQVTFQWFCKQATVNIHIVNILQKGSNWFLWKLNKFCIVSHSAKNNNQIILRKNDNEMKQFLFALGRPSLNTACKYYASRMQSGKQGKLVN